MMSSLVIDAALGFCTICSLLETFKLLSPTVIDEVRIFKQQKSVLVVYSEETKAASSFVQGWVKNAHDVGQL